MNIIEWRKLEKVYFPTPSRFDGVEDMDNLTPIERDAVLSRGREEDNQRLRLAFGQFEHQLWLMQGSVESMRAELTQAQNDRSAAEADLREAEEVIDEQSEQINALLRGEPAPSRSDNSATGDDTSSEKSNSEYKKKETGRKKKANQTQKARARADGTALSRNEIATLNKAEARAYLATMPKAAIRGNRDELRDRILRIFDVNQIDVYAKGDPVTIPTIPSLEDVGGSDRS